MSKQKGNIRISHLNRDGVYVKFLIVDDCTLYLEIPKMIDTLWVEKLDSDSEYFKSIDLPGGPKISIGYYINDIIGFSSSFFENLELKQIKWIKPRTYELKFKK